MSLAGGSPPGTTFTVGEVALAFHGGLLFDCVILSCLEGSRYKIHFDAWSQKWDETLELNRLLKRTESSRAFQRALRISADLAQEGDLPVPAEGTELVGGTPVQPSASLDALLSKTSKPKRYMVHRPYGELDLGTPVSQMSGPERKSRKKGAALVKAGSQRSHIAVASFRMLLDDSIKNRLLDDWEQVTVLHLLVPLPKHQTSSVAAILNDFYECHPSMENHTFCDAIELYFNETVGRYLLYRIEREQFSRLVRAYPGATAADVFGAEHLLRLLVKLPELLASSGCERKDLVSLETTVALFFKFLDQNSAMYFSPMYYPCPPEYKRVSTMELPSDLF